jgi:hypothetical protein
MPHTYGMQNNISNFHTMTFQPPIENQINFSNYLPEEVMNTMEIHDLESAIYNTYNNELSLVFETTYEIFHWETMGHIYIMISENGIKIKGWKEEFMEMIFDTIHTQCLDIDVPHFEPEDIDIVKEYARRSRMPYFRHLKTVILEYWNYMNNNPDENKFKIKCPSTLRYFIKNYPPPFRIVIRKLPLEMVEHVCTFLNFDDGYLEEDFDWSQFVK